MNANRIGSAYTIRQLQFSKNSDDCFGKISPVNINVIRPNWLLKFGIPARLVCISCGAVSEIDLSIAIVKTPVQNPVINLPIQKQGTKCA